MKSLLLMITFLTRIPVKYPFEFKEKDFIKGIYYMPIVGFIIGVILWSVAHLNLYIDGPVMAVILWIIYIWVTGGLHIDGLADTVDGVFSNRGRERALEIMKDSRVGSFGVLIIMMVYMMNIIVSMYLPIGIFILIPVVGRASAIVGCTFGDYAREGLGLGKGIVENCDIKEFIYAIVFTLILAIILNNQIYVLISILTTFISIYFISKYIKNKLGGFTGDTIGFTIEISQSVFILISYLLGSVNL
ncbi:adenosylcobinamide-GDP ribazoletransferase [Clostridium sp. D2Q-14]|uniref:adenosylcobinamide-GDP ribazoletransferase n=1 Tax=Anaeromonas gelatinilytica TaxID=2683194 RepID=UPI00193B660E|nr:adenosylcobinamide-GDP ribazoletransferase [Anaeromonas gelatinilytica]MBS4535496.1 adenosylcobinamide-GDP ribazoletransferase [Anaeromonas gelatinilytica]